MADQLYAGSLADFDTVPSMAQAMEAALAVQVGPLQGVTRERPADPAKAVDSYPRDHR